MTPIQLFDPSSSTYTYLLVDPQSHAAVIIDPVRDWLERDLALLQTHQLKLIYTLETHAHADHITASGLLAEHTGAQVAVPSACGVAAAAIQLNHGDVLNFGGESLSCLHTPGHTAGSMCFVWRHHVFTGDTLLINGCGRTDFQSGSAQDMYRSLTEVLFALPDDTLVWPGHDYQGRTHSTIGWEKLENARVADKSLAEFVQLMDGLHLPRPQRIDEAVPANLNCGLRHDAGVHNGEQLNPNTAGYAGDVGVVLAWQWVQDGSAVLIDVRTDAEREWVGFVPGAKVAAWKQWPTMAMNPEFDAQVKAAVGAGQKALFLCRSGVRSIAAARRATELGLEAYNIVEGFEGDPDQQAHRGNRGGWRMRGLPWRQN